MKILHENDTKKVTYKDLESGDVFTMSGQESPLLRILGGHVDLSNGVVYYGDFSYYTEDGCTLLDVELVVKGELL